MHRLKWQYARDLGLIHMDQPDDDNGGGDPADEPDPQDGADDNDELDGAPWTAENFDAKRAWSLLTKTRGDLAKVKGERDEFKSKHDEAENAKLSDLQRAEKERDDSRSEASGLQLENARLRAAIEHGLDEDDLEFIGGSTAEEIATRAAKYAERHKTAEGKTAPPTNRTRPALRGGGDPSGDGPLSPEEVAEQATRR